MNIRGTTARLRCGLSASSHLPLSLPVRRPALQALWGFAALFAVFCLTSAGSPTVWAQTPQEETVDLGATPQTNPTEVILNWQLDPYATSYQIQRKLPADAAYTTIATINAASNPPAAQATGYTDTSVVENTTNVTNTSGSTTAVTTVGPYEYAVTKNATIPGVANYTGHGNIYTGYDLPLTENRGTVLLVVDSTYASDPALATRLQQFQQDLIGDGWNVVTTDVARDPGIDAAGVPLDHGASVRALKQWIQNEYNDLNGTQTVKAVILFGHVPVPYSGNVDPDPDGTNSFRQGAYPADQYYGDVSAAAATSWTDSKVNITTANDPRTFNIPGDGKFDQNTTPDPIQLEVGRIDMSGLTEFAQSEEALLEQYLDKDHAYRTAAFTSVPEGYVENNFSLANYQDYASKGFENFGNFFTSGNVLGLEQGTFFTGNQNAEDVPSGNFLASYIASPDGAPDNLPGITVNNSSDYATYDPHSVFDLMFGDYIEDWGFNNDLMRAALAAPTYGLDAMYVGNPCWFLMHMAMGNDIGYSAVINENNANFTDLYTLEDGNTTDNTPTEVGRPTLGYIGGFGPGGIWTSLLGDPTLRLQVVTPPSELTVTPGANNSAILNWQPSPDADNSFYGGVVVGYNLYYAPTAAGPFVKLNTTIANGMDMLPSGTTTFTDTTTTGARVYQLRAVDLQTSGSGSYYNESTGIFQGYDPASPPPTVTIVSPTNGENPNGQNYNGTNGALYTEGANITVEAAATPGNQNALIQQVAFYLNGKLLSTATAAPYQASIQNIPAGQYIVSATTTDSAGNMGTSQAVRLYVFRPNVPPAAFGGGPINGWVDTSIETPTTPTPPVTRGGGTVTLNLPGALFTLQVSPFDTSPYSGLYLTGSFTTNGTAAGQLLKITCPTTGVLNQTIEVPMPNINTTYYFTMGLTGITGTPGGSINQQMNIDGITIQDLHNTAQSFTIDNLSFEENGRRGDAAPVVQIINPTTGTTAATPYDVNLEADAADTDSGIAAIDFYDNGTFIGTGTAPANTSNNPNSYSTYTLPLTDVAPGTHVYTAVAISELGRTTTSASVKVTVENEPDIGGLVTTPAEGSGASAVAAQPISGATVTVTNASTGQVVATYTTGSTSPGPDSTLVTPTTVNYVNVLDPGTYNVTAYAPIYGTTAPVSVTIPTVPSGSSPGFHRVDITLPAPPTTLDGVVTDAATGSPVSGATVTVYTPAANSTQANPVAGAIAGGPFATGAESTDPLGNAENYLGALTAGTYVATASATGYGTTTPVYITVTANAINTQNFQLPASSSTLGGLVTDAGTGQPVQGAIVSLLNTDGTPVTDSNGNAITFTTGAPESTPATTASTQASLIGVSVGPSAIYDNAGTTGTVTLSGPAPSGGEIVTLTTSNSSAASVPPSITVPAGATTTSFPIATSTVSADTQVTISGILAGVTQSTSVTVNSAGFALSLSSSSVTTGTGLTGTVTLLKTLTTDTVVTLTSSSNSAVVPATVTVPAGSLSATFSINTYRAATGVTISASANGQGTGNTASASQGLTITSNPEINYLTPLAAGTYQVQAKSATGSSPLQSVTVAANGFTRADLSLGPQLQSLSFAVGGLSVNNPVISDGGTATGTVTLSEAAPPGGTFVSLATSNTAAVSVTYGVTVPAGQTTATFTVTANSVSSATTVTITGTSDSTSVTAQVTVDPVPIASLSFSPTTIGAGATSTGTVSLNASGTSIVAPTGGLVVSLTSSNPAVTVPTTVTIPAGSPSATFTATGTNVAASTTAQVTASAGNSSVQASLTVTPGALSGLSVSPTAVIGDAGSTGTVTLSGPAPSGGLTVSLSAATTSPSGGATGATVASTVTVPAGSTTATFPITTLGVSSTTVVTLTASAGSVTETATVTIDTIGFNLSLSTSSASAGTPVVGTVTLGQAAPAPTVVTLSSSNASAASVPASVTVAAGATTATFQVTTYTAASGVVITANLSGQSSAQNLTVTANSGYSYAAGWDLLSLPYDYTSQTPAQIFGFSTATLFQWSPLQLQYVTTSPTTADAVHPGVGYWVYFPQAAQVTTVGSPTDTSQPFSVALLPGWNMIGDPFNVSESVSALEVTSGSSTYSYANATGLLLALYGYTPGALGAVGNYNLIGSSGSLVPGQGYWIYSTQSLTLTSPSPGSTTPPPPVAP